MVFFIGEARSRHPPRLLTNVKKKMVFLLKASLSTKAISRLKSSPTMLFVIKTWPPFSHFTHFLGLKQTIHAIWFSHCFRWHIIVERRDADDKSHSGQLVQCSVIVLSAFHPHPTTHPNIYFISCSAEFIPPPSFIIHENIFAQKFITEYQISNIAAKYIQGWQHNASIMEPRSNSQQLKCLA